MISLIKKIHIHPVFWGILGIGGLTGMFKEIVMLFLIVLVHELGHSYMAYRFNWRIKKIMLLPFGGMAETEEYGNRPVREELLVTISGPIQHLWLIGGSYLLLHTPIWTEADHQIFLFHNLTILFFNLLPILPLDGGKLVFAGISYFNSFHRAQQWSYISSIIILSILSFCSLSFLPFHLNLIVVLVFLWIHHYLEWKQRHFMFLRFLLERKRVIPRGYSEWVKVSPSITVAEAMKHVNRQKYHYFTFGKKDTFIEEEKVLEAFFDLEKRFLPLGKLI
ncbi:M50 family metallopeptidase [Evansella cellulosilytica]|uniref:Peptidase M50 n=1 Tax=Evansella cellulosilytica (strain ATCC 21833 / DSM 2522 / FERM P-1141 / JCM 9156 / N-4) TaxID=649639 RepID=E6TYU4_EVAC2|nr:M50 family metallopeptidase [Evansella cellulosilytica]ADU31279.1 peptidase M50 [Evansella cellulosilytica DSM 2522]